MRPHFVAGLFMFGLVACGVSQSEDAAGSAATIVTTHGWQPSLPPFTSSMTPTKTIRLRGCDFTVGTAVITPPQPMLDGGISPPPVPPVFIAYVQRGLAAHGPRWCTPAFVAYGASASPDVHVDIAVKQGKPLLVVDYTFRIAQDAREQLGIVEVDVATGDVACRTNLSANPGNVTSGALSLDPHGTLTATGTKDGPIPGEAGSGSHYVAAWADFLGSETCPSSPTSLVAF